MIFKIRQLILLIVLFVAALSCREESVVPTSNELGNADLLDGRVSFSFFTNSLQFERPSTRMGVADEHNATGDAWLFVFDATAADTILLEVVKASDHQPTAFAGQSRRTVILKQRDHAVTLLVIDNAPDKIFNGVSELTITDAHSWGIAPGASISMVRSSLNTILLSSPTQQEVPYTPNLAIPMSAEINLQQLSPATALGTESEPLALLRVVAKIVVEKAFASVQGDARTPLFDLRGATLYNSPRNASLSPYHKENSANLTDFIGSSIGQEVTGIAPADGISTLNHPIYSYPSAQSDPSEQPFVIIQARFDADKEDSFYKLLFNPEGKRLGRIERNAAYSFSISQCTGRGYSTLQEAIENVSSNLTYNVEITDLASHDLLDNGQYYIGLTNTEYHFYAFNSFVNLQVASLNTGTNPGVTVAPLIGTITSSDPVNLIVQTPTFAHPATDFSIMIDVTKSFTSGLLKIRLGNLTQEVVVKRMGNNFIEFKNELIVIDNYSASNFKVASVASPANWIKVGASSAVTLASGQDAVATNGGIYIAYNANLAPPKLESSIYISRSDKGRLKAQFFLAPLSFISTLAPVIINMSAKDLNNSSGPYTFTFFNPSAHSFQLALFANGGVPSVSTAVKSLVNASSSKELTFSPFIESDKSKLPRMFVAKYKVGAYWYELNYELTQQEVL